LNKIDFIKILLKYKNDNILNNDDAGKSPYEMAKILNYLDILNLFGIFNNNKDDFLENEKNKNLMLVFHFIDFKFIYNKIYQ
jgi:hypothetical protein